MPAHPSGINALFPVKNLLQFNTQAMSDDLILHLSSNSSNQSDQSSKIAKLEARLVGKPSSVVASQPQVQAQLNSWSVPAKFGGTSDSLPDSLVDSDDSDDDNGGAFLIQANTQKRRKVEEDSGAVVVHVEAKTIETVDSNKVGSDVNKRKQGRGRANSLGRGRGNRAADQARNQMISQSNGQAVNSHHKEEFFKEQLGNDGYSSTEELQDFKDYEQQMKPKRMKVISDLLISVSKAERHEARMKVRQDSLRLGNVGVIRNGFVANMRSLLETKEAIERQRKSLKKRQPDKGDIAETEGGVQEEDILIQDEIFKSRLASIKREEETVMRERDRYELRKENLFAFDLVEHRYVACKLHGLNAQWSEDKKQSYIRHAIREYNIHKTLVHHHIVRLWDIFEIDHNTFCTVLEYCSGKDLDAVLKATPILPEREARIIIVQIFQGLILVLARLWRMMLDPKAWNLLPRVLEHIGIFLQNALSLTRHLSFPQRRPFGHDQTQERILREDTIIKARKVEFPSRPSVSNEAKVNSSDFLAYLGSILKDN
ncbi:hypothetical protein DH2020_000532 [Rehmannia glutinosa]|uniref:Protein kinase domain-containing protein n=1 Tax=Rehmannia glutinosa TaxID=99300 RepID=A0ABR0XWV8_REHGL